MTKANQGAGLTKPVTFYSGNSMWPTLSPGDKLVVEETDARSLRRGEVVVYRPPRTGDADSLAVHRVLYVRQENGTVRIRTQGDNQRKPDPEWPAGRLLGRVVAVDPVKGKPYKLYPAPFYGWRMRHRLSFRRVVRALARRVRRAGSAVARLVFRRTG